MSGKNASQLTDAVGDAKYPPGTLLCYDVVVPAKIALVTKVSIRGRTLGGDIVRKYDLTVWRSSGAKRKLCCLRESTLDTYYSVISRKNE